MGQAKRRATKIRLKAVGSGIFGRFPNFAKRRSEVAGDVISGVAVDYVGMDVRATFGESGLNSGRIILLFGRPHPFHASLFVQYLIAFCSRPETTSDIISRRFM